MPKRKPVSRKPVKPTFRYEVMYVNKDGPQTWDWAQTLSEAREIAGHIAGAPWDKVFIAEWTFKEWHDAA